MPQATVEQIALLEPYLSGQADDQGEIGMFCPMHGDTRSSASVNIIKGVWFCQSGCGGGSLRQLCDARDTWVQVVGRVKAKRRSFARSTSTGELPSERQVLSWRHSLDGNQEVLSWLRDRRGITANTAKRAHIGLNGHIKIPIYDEDRNLVNVRSYDRNPAAGRRKIWSIKGRGQPHLYPIRVLTTASPGDKVLFMEGEWDTLVTLQSGLLAITRTAAAKSAWRSEWNDWFEGLRVYLCHDADRAGQDGNQIVAEGLEGVAAGLWQCELPYRIRPKGGKDVTDLVLARGIAAVRRMMTKAERVA